MKKLLHVSLIISLVLGTAVFATGCGSKDESAATPYSQYNLDDYIEVGEYNNLEYKDVKIEVTEKDKKDKIQETLENYKETEEVTKGKVEDGDTINVSFEGKIDGETFEGGTSDDFDITVGQTSMIDGFVEGLVGKKIGSTVTLDLTFPDPYKNNEALSGKPVTFEVNIKSKKVDKIPEYNMDFVSKNFPDCESLEAFEKTIEDQVMAEKEYNREATIKEELWLKIVESSNVIQYPAEKDNLIATTIQNFKDEATNQGLEWEAFLEQSGMDEEQLTENISSYAETQIKQEMVLYSIAAKEGLVVDEDEYKTYMSSILTEAGFDEETFKNYTGQTIEEYCETQGLRTSMMLDKVMNKIIETAKAAK